MAGDKSIIFFSCTNFEDSSEKKSEEVKGEGTTIVVNITIVMLTELNICTPQSSEGIASV